MIARHRSIHVPRIPHSLEEFGETLLSDQWLQELNVCHNDELRRPFFREVLRGVGEQHGEWMAGIYLSARLATSLAGTARIHMDATFKTLPVHLQAYQLLTVHAEYMHYVSMFIDNYIERKQTTVLARSTIYLWSYNM